MIFPEICNIDEKQAEVKLKLLENEIAEAEARLSKTAEQKAEILRKHL